MNFGDPQNTGLHPRCNACTLVINLEPLLKGTDDDVITSFKKYPNSQKFLLFFLKNTTPHNKTLATSSRDLNLCMEHRYRCGLRIVELDF